MRRWIAPWEYRRLHAWAGVRIAGGTAALILGAIVVSQVPDAWAIFGALLMAGAVANYLAAAWFLTIANSDSANA